MATTGVVGQHWRATVTGAGAVEPHDGTAPLAWHVAADDRWHDPSTDTGVRHRRVAGTAVFETKVRIPGGDAVQRVWSVADADGYTLISVHNDSPAPIAVAFTRGDLATRRPAAENPIEGVTLPSDSVVFPVGHRATITVGLAHGRRGASTLLPGLATADAVIRGWVTRTAVASRLDVPEQALVDAVRAARCELLLDGVAAVDAEPERHLLGLCELLRLGDLDPRSAADAAPRIAQAVAAVVRRRHWLGSAALDAAAVVLAAAGECRALADLVCLRAAVTNSVTSGGTSLEVPPDDVAAIPIVERRVAVGSMLFPSGIPERWRGHDFEVHDLLAGPASRLSLAVRWHGADAAVLWEVAGEPVTLTSTVGAWAWSSAQPRGEVLWQFARGGEN